MNGATVNLPPTLAARRVAILTPRLSHIGGTELYVHRLLQVQRELGLQVRIVVAEPTPPLPALDWLEVEVCPEAFADSDRTWRTGRGNQRLAALADTLCAWADWVEFHLVASLELTNLLAGRLPSLLFMHTARLTCAAKSRYLPRSMSCCERAPGLGCLYGHWRDDCLSNSEDRTALRDLLAAVMLGRSSRALVDDVDKLVFNSEALSQLFQRTVTAVREKARVLAPPMIMPGVSSTRRGRDMLFLGRYFKQKGVLDAVRVAAALPGRSLQLYGSGPCKAEAMRLAQEFGVTAHFHDWGDANTIARALAEAGCLLIPTRAFEAWGMVGPEAIAQGCPVAAYDVGGIREWLHPEFGESVAHGDVAALAEAARRQLARIDAGLETSHWRKTAEDNWGMDSFARHYANLVSEVLGKRGAA